MEKAEKEESEAKKTKTQNLGIKPDSTPKIGNTFRRMTKVELYGKKQTQYDKKLKKRLRQEEEAKANRLAGRTRRSAAFG